MTSRARMLKVRCSPPRLDDFTAPSGQDDVRRWLCDVHSTVWHEIGHLEHSDCLTNVMDDVTLKLIATDDERVHVAFRLYRTSVRNG
jgi:hypothetical protein